MFIVNDRSTATAFSLLMAGTVISSQSTLLTDQLTDKLCNQSLKIPLPHPATPQQCHWKCPQMSTGKLCCHYVPKLPDITTPKTPKESRNSFAFGFSRKQGKPEQLRLEAVKPSLQHDEDAKYLLGATK